jgi:nucleoside-diphosphate kinase
MTIGPVEADWKVFTREHVRNAIETHDNEAAKALRLEIDEMERENLQKVIDICEHPALSGLIDQGKITYAMIKPNLDGIGKNGYEQYTDEELANMVEKDVNAAGFVVLTNVAVPFSNDDVNEFYADVQEGLLAAGKRDIWERLSRLMQSGAVSMMLLYDPDGNKEHPAFKHWREAIGPTDPKKAPENTIRGKYGVSLDGSGNNVVHGSDSTASVHKEVRWATEKLRDVIRCKKV